MNDRVLDATITHAYAALNAGQIASTDKIVCNPKVRADFLWLFRSMTVEVVEEEKVLRRLLGLRKAKRLPAYRDIQKKGEPQ